jgi:DNA-binding beta-propeller fold protein YncE
MARERTLTTGGTGSISGPGRSLSVFARNDGFRENDPVVGTFAVGSLPNGIAFDGTHLWVANQGSNSVTELDTVGTPRWRR